MVDLSMANCECHNQMGITSIFLWFSYGFPSYKPPFSYGLVITRWYMTISPSCSEQTSGCAPDQPRPLPESGFLRTRAAGQ